MICWGALIVHKVSTGKMGVSDCITEVLPTDVEVVCRVEDIHFVIIRQRVVHTQEGVGVVGDVKRWLRGRRWGPFR